MIKKLLLLIMVFTILLTSTGCWDRKELNELGIVMAIGFDKDPKTGEIVLSSQVVRPSQLKQKSMGQESISEILTTTNKTIFGAIRDTIKESDRKSFFSHIKVIVVSEEVARDGINDIIDFVARSQEIRKFSWIMVTHDTPAKQILTIKYGIENIQAAYMEGIITKQKFSSDTLGSRVIDFITIISDEGINPITGVFNITNLDTTPPEGKKSSEAQALLISEAAVFHQDKLVGFLDKTETRGFSFAIGRMKGGTTQVISTKEKDKYISIEIKQVKSKITTVIKDKKISFNIHVKVDGNITEVQTNENISKLEVFNELNNTFKQYVENDIKTAVNKLQKDLKTDILGFGNVFYRKYPKVWKKTEPEWDNIFPNVEYSVNVETYLRRTGLLLKPLSSK